ncbi:MAG: hypothetical protein OJF47_000636 [Nitrospira sp.]|nr:MAG: hypothetical protein OJF47_000636 [Nitrospira sp.]
MRPGHGRAGGWCASGTGRPAHRLRTQAAGAGQNSRPVHAQSSPGARSGHSPAGLHRIRPALRNYDQDRSRTGGGNRRVGRGAAPDRSADLCDRRDHRRLGRGGHRGRG